MVDMKENQIRRQIESHKICFYAAIINIKTL